MSAIGSVIEVLLRSGAKSAVKFLSEKQIVRATRKTFKSANDPRANVELTLTLGRPNFAERKFVKLCKKAGEKFPVKKIQLKFAKK